MSSTSDILAGLVPFDTQNPGGDEEALARHLADRLRGLGADSVELIDVDRPGKSRGHSVFARWGRPRLLFNAHLDTVPVNPGWQRDPHRTVIENGRLYGLGSSDTKGGIAAVLAALAAVPRVRDVGVLFSGDEELGSLCMEDFLVRGLAEEVEQAVVCEPTACQAGTRHRGILTYHAHYQGKGGHSSLADQRPAPIAELARLAVALDAWGKLCRDEGPEGFKGVCMNVAMLEGGVAVNVIPDRARLSFSLRPAPGRSVDEVHGEIAGLCARVLPKAVLETELRRPAFECSDPGGFVEVLGDVARKPIDLPYWTEAALLETAGVPCVVFGPGEVEQAHAPDESVSLADLETAERTFIEALRRRA